MAACRVAAFRSPIPAVTILLIRIRSPHFHRFEAAGRSGGSQQVIMKVPMASGAATAPDGCVKGVVDVECPCRR